MEKMGLLLVTARQRSCEKVNLMSLHLCDILFTGGGGRPPMEGHLVAANKVGGTHHTGMHSYYNKHLAKFKVPFGILETTVDINEGLFFFKRKNIKLLLSSQQGNAFQASFSNLHSLIKTILPHSLELLFVHFRTFRWLKNTQGVFL